MDSRLRRDQVEAGQHAGDDAYARQAEKNAEARTEGEPEHP